MKAIFSKLVEEGYEWRETANFLKGQNEQQASQLSALRSEVARLRAWAETADIDKIEEEHGTTEMKISNLRAQVSRLSADRLTKKQAWAIFGLGIKPERGTYSSEYSGNDYAKALRWLRGLSEQGEDKR